MPLVTIPWSPGALVGVFSPVLWALLRASRRCERVQSRRMRALAARLSLYVDTVLRNSHKYGYAMVAFKASSWFASTRATVRTAGCCMHAVGECRRCGGCVVA